MYDTAITYNVTAGVGTFNASYVAPFLDYLQLISPGYNYRVLPYNYYAVVFNLVIDPTYSGPSSPVNYFGDDFSYLLTGGLQMATPWTPSGYEDYPLVKIEHIPSVQLDFSSFETDVFHNDDCSVYGQDTTAIGVRLCVTGNVQTGIIYAGMYTCQNGTQGGACQTAEPVPNITTRLRVFERQATVLVSRLNYSIVDVGDLTTPYQVMDIDVSAYRAVLDWLLNYTATDIPAPSSIVENFWISGDQLRSSSTHACLTQNFQSILAFPFWMFNANNYGNTALQVHDIVATLPPQFYTQASIVAPHSKISFDRNMFYIFIVLQGLAMLFTCGTLLWAWFSGVPIPRISAYPLFDSTFKSSINPEINSGDAVLADSSEVLRMASGVTAVQR